MVQKVIQEKQITDLDASKTTSGVFDTARIPDLDASKTTTGVFDADRIPIVVPTGVVWPYAGVSPPSGFLLCDGSEYNPATYPDLFAVIGYTYGMGSGSPAGGSPAGGGSPAKFKVPDLRGNVPAGVDGGTFTSLGTIVGNETHTLSDNEMPSHNHSGSSVSGSTDPDGSHSHLSVNGAPNTYSPGFTQSITGSGSHSDANTTTSSDGSHSHTLTGTTVSIATDGSDQPHNNIQPSMALNYIISV